MKPKRKPDYTLKQYFEYLDELKRNEMEEKYGDKSEGKDPLTENGKGYHLDLVQSVFDCPICTCENDITSALDKAKLPIFNVKCKGCKRKLQAFSCPITGKLTVTEIINSKHGKEKSGS